MKIYPGFGFGLIPVYTIKYNKIYAGFGFGVKPSPPLVPRPLY